MTIRSGYGEAIVRPRIGSRTGCAERHVAAFDPPSRWTQTCREPEGGHRADRGC